MKFDTEAEQPRDTALLFQDAYPELHQIASRLMVTERFNHTLTPTALVNESFVRLGASTTWDSNSHFYSAATVAMRRVLIDWARARACQKRQAQQVSLNPAEVDDSASATELALVEINDLLSVLEVEDPLAAELVGLKLFGGLSVVDAGNLLGLKRWSAYQLWDFAQAWFQSKMAPAD